MYSPDTLIVTFYYLSVFFPATLVEHFATVLLYFLDTLLLHSSFLFCSLLLHVLHIFGIIHLLSDACLYMHFHVFAYFPKFESGDMVCLHDFAIAFAISPILQKLNS